jgi:two-component system, chemotaxis family, chemotaxis protein CheY
MYFGGPVPGLDTAFFQGKSDASISCGNVNSTTKTRQMQSGAASGSVQNLLYSLDSATFTRIAEGQLYLPVGAQAMRILIVDDCETTRRILRVIARSRHWTVCGEAESGRSGIREFQRVKPDVVLIDLAMPDINGIEAAKRMSVLNPRIPLILFTVLNADGLQDAAQDAGISSIVSKAQAWDLIGTVENTARRFRQAATQRVM